MSAPRSTADILALVRSQDGGPGVAARTPEPAPAASRPSPVPRECVATTPTAEPETAATPAVPPSITEMLRAVRGGRGSAAVTGPPSVAAMLATVRTRPVASGDAMTAPSTKPASVADMLAAVRTRDESSPREAAPTTAAVTPAPEPVSITDAVRAWRAASPGPVRRRFRYAGRPAD